MKYTAEQIDQMDLSNLNDAELDALLEYTEEIADAEAYQVGVEYNIHDVKLVDRLNAKLGFLEQAFAIAYSSKVMYTDTLASVKIWDVILHNHLSEKGIVVDPDKRNNKIRPNAGGFVKQPIAGMYKWLVSFDLNSLYPSLIQQFNISPETYIDSIAELQDYCDGVYDYAMQKFTVLPAPEKCVDVLLAGYIDDEKKKVLVDNNLVLSASGAFFDRTRRGFIAEVMANIYNDRTTFKKKMIEAKKKLELIKAELETKGSTEFKNLSKDDLKKLKDKTEIEVAKNHNMQLAKKILLNSGYGAVSNEYFRWFDLKLSEAITVSGQYALRYIERAVNLKMNAIMNTTGVDYVIAADTDSIYLCLDTYVETLGELDTLEIVDHLDKFSNDVIEPYITEQYQIMADEMNAYEQKMFMKREAIADKGIWTAKKKYVLNVYDNEGVRFAEPEQKITGIEAVRSSTPTACRSAIKECIKIIMTSTEDAAISYIEETREMFNTKEFEDISFPRSVNNLAEYSDPRTVYKKGCPIAVRGALLYNNLIDRKDLGNTLPKIKEGDKVRFCYLKMPNPLHENIIAVPSELPKELDLDRYIDYNTQFEKGFLNPVSNILESIHWRTDDSATLEDFFS